jgi:hypothetical protein
MGKVGGVALFVVGIGFGAYLVPIRSEVEQSSRTEPSSNKASTEIAVHPGTTSPVQVTKVLPHPNDRVSITRELQKELKRVGCYDGEINATWTPPTRKGMRDFIDRVNASLPVEQPDNILLSLVQNHPDKACGRSCPAGEGMSQDGKRCIPSALLAQAAKKPWTAANATGPKPPPIEKMAPMPTDMTGRSADPPPTGRMALAGPAEQEASSRNAQREGGPLQVRTHARARRVLLARPYDYRRSARASRPNFVQTILRQKTTSMY